VVQRKSQRWWQQHLGGGVASAAALTINNQLKLATAVETETATMTATMMTMETKSTAATCCCLRRCRRQPCYHQAATATAKLAAAYTLLPRFRCPHRQSMWSTYKVYEPIHMRWMGIWNHRQPVTIALVVPEFDSRLKARVWVIAGLQTIPLCSG